MRGVDTEEEFQCCAGWRCCQFHAGCCVLSATQACRLWASVGGSEPLWTYFCTASNFDTVKLSRRLTMRDSYRIQLRQSRSVVRLKGQKLLIFNCKDKLVKGITIEHVVATEGNHRLAFVSDDSIILVGGSINAWRLSEKTYWIRMDGSMLQLRDLLEPRKEHGIVVWQGCLYVFGGMAAALLNSSEKLVLNPLAKLRTRPWDPLPNMMSEKSNFCPVGNGQKIYLCGGVRQRIEAFDIVEECFFELSFRLPQGMWYSAVYYKREILIFNYQTILRWKVNTSQYEERSFVNQGYYLYDQMNPALYQDAVYQIAGDNTINIFTVATRKFSKLGY